jgi:prepilin-type N-terminal cleavage/methylation domain-containing protein
MQRRQAFTLVELMIAVMIIALLSAFATSNFLTAQRNARDNARKSLVHAVVGSVERYYAVTRNFPGRIDASDDVGGAPINLTAYNQSARGCQFIIDNSSNAEYPYVYSYTPYSTGQGCDTPPVAVPDLSGPSGTKTVYKSTDYSPSSTWIPGLGDYLAPSPVERRYVDPSGNTVIPFAANGVSDLLTTTELRTIQYRHLRGGYAVLTKLESLSVDQDSLPLTTNDDQPFLPKKYRSAATTPPGTGIGVTNPNVYMVRN